MKKIYMLILYITNLNWSVDTDKLKNMDIKENKAYRSPENPVDISFINDQKDNGKIKVQRALTLSQVIVFYSSEKVLGGG